VLRSLFVSAAYCTFLVLGLSAPFVFTLGYVWVDTFNPQFIATEFLTSFPVALVMAAAAIGGYLLLDRRSATLPYTSVLILMLAAWVTLSTTLWAVVPDDAWGKWDWAFKTLVFSAFIPLVIRSQIQIEAFLQIYVFALAVQFMPLGIKTLVSGGGYGKTLGIMSANYGLAEGSTLAAVSLMLVPLIFYLRKHTRILPRTRVVTLIYLGLVVSAVAAAIGTYERTGLIGMVVAGVGLWLRSRHKIVTGIAGLAIVALVATTVSQSWDQRISTIQSYNQDESALGRLLVWKWTLGYVKTHPLGGGFDAFEIDRIEFPPQPGSSEPEVVFGKAFHSVYFEMLGEHGWVGLGLFLTLAVSSLVMLQNVARGTRGIEAMAWCRDLAIALQIALVTMLACGAFIGVAFQPMFYYLFALSACLRQYRRKVVKASRPIRLAGLAEAGP